MVGRTCAHPNSCFDPDVKWYSINGSERSEEFVMLAFARDCPANREIEPWEICIWRGTDGANEEEKNPRLCRKLGTFGSN